MDIMRLDAATATTYLPKLIAILEDSVRSGASIGFVPPLAGGEAQAYWEGRIKAVTAQTSILIVALDGQRVAGTAQLALEQKVNGNHRAEVQKVLVHTAYRRHGIGRELMLALESIARDENRSLLLLDTLLGDAGEHLYRKVGYIQAGVIPYFARNENGILESTVLYYKYIG